MPAHTDDEGKAELRLVGVVQAMEADELLLGEGVEPRARLLVLRIVGDRTSPCRLAREIGMIAQEGELGVARRGPHRPHHGRVQVGHRRERPLGVGRCGNPRRQFEGLTDGCFESRKVHTIEVGEHHGHACRTSMPTRPSL